MSTNFGDQNPLVLHLFLIPEGRSPLSREWAATKDMDMYRIYQHRGTISEDSVQRSWTATFFRIFVFFLYPEKYGGSKTVLKSEIGLVDHIQKK